MDRSIAARLAAWLFVSVLSVTSQLAGAEDSANLYRLPYADGTKIHVNRDFEDHDPPGKFDIVGRGNGPYKIVAAAAGHVRYLQDSRDKQQNPQRFWRNTNACNNNYLWIEHADGEWTKYSHMRQWSSSGQAGLRVGDEVSEGQYLGDEGKVGCAWPEHLHFEVVRPDANTDVSPTSGDLAGVRLVPRFFNDGAELKLEDGKAYTVNPEPECKNNSDCSSSQYCNKGIDTKKNRCVAKRADNETCEVAGGADQCMSGKCRFGRCYTPQSVAMGGTCYNDDACAEGKCSDVDGAKGACVCKSDNDCSSSKYCDKGLDAKVNECRPKLAAGESCGKAGSVGNDHKCLSGTCSGFPKYKCK
ncbi:hypothetical protein GCM10011487_61540 [Steroidobacter agaridevorans]|uniref:M23ase beta-sheet core domain-containing protein n=1 Tax=Steroidobacter agaridevorans TaxID=2695856 RepID=A0A829YL51_9GAMM|nr:M23 family metallopeptidase [Steroidobacter agaridevorans]GFE84154.1 hypothetical protein GCM10011487_61540 [Steroidobacter agaridevorans]GFE86976.1 hypothetical protein GCM10011488_19300 [Steroidobacter agaridevorans]